MRSWHCQKLAQKKQSCQGTHVSFASFPASSNTFNPLFKVLFIFPSRYLFAIGLAHICSCRWNLPPVLRSSPKERDSMKSTVHNDMHMTHRTFTFLDILFQEAFMRTVAGHSSPKNNSRLMAPIPMLSLSMFIRHYLWNPIWFLILHLLICLNSVGVLTWYHISNLAFKTTKKQGHAGLQCMQQVQMLYCSACLYSTCLSQHIKTVCLDVHKCHTTLHVNDHLYTDESWSKFACKSIPEASHTFKILLVHRNLQFTMFIALRCTLHGRSSRDIHCWKCFSVCCYHQINSSTVLDRAAAAIWTCQNSCCLKLQSRGRSLSLSKAYTRMSLTTSKKYTNDPSAGSPTETLLRLLLPLSDKVH